MVVGGDCQRPGARCVVIVATQLGGGTGGFGRIKPLIDLSTDRHVKPAGSASELPDAGSAGTRKGAIFKGRFDQRQECDVGRYALSIEDLLKRLKVTSRPNDSIAESFFDS